MTTHFVQQLEELHRKSIRLGVLVEDIVDEACEAAFDRNLKLAERVIRRDQEVDAAEVQIEAETVRIMALFQPVGADLRLLFTILKVNNDLERIADCAVNVAERAKHIKQNALENNREVLMQMAQIAQRMLRSAVQTYSERGSDSAVVSLDDVVDALYADTIRKLIASAPRDTDDIAAVLDVLSIAKNLERIADHVTNIMEDLVFLRTGTIVRHRDLTTPAQGQPPSTQPAPDAPTRTSDRG